MINSKVPRWYQDLSFPQMEIILCLGKLIKHDHDEQITDRTQRALHEVGITSTYVKIRPKDIRNLWTMSNLNPVEFLSEIYRFITGRSFHEEAYKKFYDCNERIVLSSIAFLTLPEIIVELDKRLPLGKFRKIPPKPTPPRPLPRKLSPESPYLEYPIPRPDWRVYRDELRKWQELKKSIVNPRVILPPSCLLQNYHENQIIDEISQKQPSNIEILENIRIEPEISEADVQSRLLKKKMPKSKTKSLKSQDDIRKSSQFLQKEEKSSRTSGSIKRSKVSGIDKKISKIRENIGKSEINETKGIEEIEEIVSVNEVERDDDSDIKSYFSELPRKFYPPGRENLSQKWQDFLMDVEEDFTSLEKEANEILRRVRETTREIFNPDVCDDCCACRESRFTAEKEKKKKNPNLIIDNVVTDEITGNRYVVGSLGIVSPAQSISDSSLMKPLIIPSEDQILKTQVIDSITLNEKGEPLLISSGISKQINHIPEKIIQKPPLPRKNVPPCNCHENIDHADENGKIDENREPCPDENSNCFAQTFRKELFNKCGKCSQSSTNNEIFLEFEKKFREREEREEKEREVEREKRKIRPHSRKLEEESRACDEEPENLEKCTKCGDSPEKCKPPNPLKDYLENLVKDKEKGKKKPSKSGAKEYRENLKFSVAGLASDSANLIDGVTVHTPITITPVSSEEEIVYKSGSQHRHWSVTEFQPMEKSRLTRIEKILKKHSKIEKSKEFVDDGIKELFKQVKTVGIAPVASEIIPKDLRSEKSVKSMKNSEELKLLKATSELEKKEKKIGKEVLKKGEDEEGLRKNEEKIRGVRGRNRRGDGGEEKKNEEREEKSGKNVNLKKLMIEALKEMADEGYIFAKLPQCHKIPVLQMWIEYRQGFKVHQKSKKEELQQIKTAWESVESQMYKKIKAPVLPLTDTQKEALTYDQIGKLKQQIDSKKKLFHSTIRKNRVLNSRAMWTLMEYEKYPIKSFKNSYFIYQASKESDGFLLKPYGFHSSESH